MFCTKCGNQIKDGFKFCPKCGTPVYVEKIQQSGFKEGAHNQELKKTEDIKEEKVTNVETDHSKEEGYLSHKTTKLVPNPQILEALDIEGVKKLAEQGDRDAILRQAFRYEMGIGVDKNSKKAKELYAKTGNAEEIITSSVSMYLFCVELKDNLCTAS